VNVELVGKTDGWLHLTVSDDGRGMPAATPPTAGRGLQIMRYRAALIGASVSIRPGDKRGTVVSCSLRLPSPPAQGETQTRPAPAGDVVSRRKASPPAPLKRKAAQREPVAPAPAATLPAAKRATASAPLTNRKRPDRQRKAGRS
jgi:hypothetical protein